jgi:hypothetical protein
MKVFMALTWRIEVRFQFASSWLRRKWSTFF